MNKKPGLLFSIAIFTIIIVAVSFDLNLGGGEPPKLRAGVNPDSVLYVCEVLPDSSWTQAAQSLRMLSGVAPLFFSFIGIILCFSWGWALYQNLLKDKFSADAYKNPWGITKVFFWMIVIFTILIMTPNHFRRVDVGNDTRTWVLCESTSDGAKAVTYKAVRLH